MTKQIVSVVIAGLVLEFVIYAWGAHAGYEAGVKRVHAACMAQSPEKDRP
jgi:hypothetical protein